MAAVLAERLRLLATQRPTYIFAELLRLADELEQQGDDDMEALARLVTPPAAPDDGPLRDTWRRKRGRCLR